MGKSGCRAVIPWRLGDRPNAFCCFPDGCSIEPPWYDGSTAGGYIVRFNDGGSVTAPKAFCRFPDVAVIEPPWYDGSTAGGLIFWWGILSTLVVKFPILDVGSNVSYDTF